jgi:glycosyltransferase involved in cell wall biosynthesis
MLILSMSKKISKISLVGTAYNEEGNIKEFCLRSDHILKTLGVSYEIIVVDDGSFDGTYDVLVAVKQELPNLRIIQLQRNYGQTAALAAGFEHAIGDVVFVFDTDLQQDPADISVLYKKFLEGYDVVSGRRMERKHAGVYRLIAYIGFLLRRFLLDIPIKDTACSPNAYRRTIIRDLSLYGEMHRFLVPLFYWRGFRVVEVSVPHYPRKMGASKYSVFKSVRALLDLMIVKFWMGYSFRPMHFFGGIGIMVSIAGFLIGLYVFIARTVDPNALIGSTIPIFSVLLILVGLQFLFFGVLADIVMRVYFHDRPTYYIRTIL